MRLSSALRSLKRLKEPKHWKPARFDNNLQTVLHSRIQYVIGVLHEVTAFMNGHNHMQLTTHKIQ